VKHVLTIDSAIVDAIVAHARRDHPDEACGIVAGPIGGDLPTRHIAMDNAARSMTFYEFDSMEYLRVWREMDDNDEEAVVIYHSHTSTEAYPSRTDADIAGWPDAHYLLVSTREPESEEIRSFRIVDGVVTEEKVNIVDATVDA
jgi:proteasome lid subunit RPN8/RPN11